MGFADKKNSDLMLALEQVFAWQFNDAKSLEFIQQVEKKDTWYTTQAQDVRYSPHALIVPAAYLENTWAYKHVIALAQNDAKVILLVAYSCRGASLGAPGLTTAFPCPVKGVIDVERPSEVNAAEHFLAKMKVDPPYIRMDFSDKENIRACFSDNRWWLKEEIQSSERRVFA